MDAPFVVVIDTREQLPFEFGGLRADARNKRQLLTGLCKRGTLASGDYSIAGHESQIAIERKSLADLYRSLGHGRHRFKREIERLSVMRYAAVVVEADWMEISESPPEFSRLSPKVVWRTILAWQMEFPTVHWWCCPGRRLAEITTFRLLERFWNFHRESASPVTYARFQEIQEERDRLREIVDSLATRVAAQSELLTKRAEKTIGSVSPQ